MKITTNVREFKEEDQPFFPQGLLKQISLFSKEIEHNGREAYRVKHVDEE
jgi:hypothetical protein